MMTVQRFERFQKAPLGARSIGRLDSNLCQVTLFYCDLNLILACT